MKIYSSSTSFAGSLDPEKLVFVQKINEDTAYLTLLHRDDGVIRHEIAADAFEAIAERFANSRSIKTPTTFFPDYRVINTFTDGTWHLNVRDYSISSNENWNRTTLPEGTPLSADQFAMMAELVKNHDRTSFFFSEHIVIDEYEADLICFIPRPDEIDVIYQEVGGTGVYYPPPGSEPISLWSNAFSALKTFISQSYPNSSFSSINAVIPHWKNIHQITNHNGVVTINNNEWMSLPSSDFNDIRTFLDAKSQGLVLTGSI